MCLLEPKYYLIIRLYFITSQSRGGSFKFPYWTGDIRLSVHFSSRSIEASVCNADFNVCLPLRQSRPVETMQCVCEVEFNEVLCAVKRQMARRLVIIPTNVLRLVNMKLRRTLLREDVIIRMFSGIYYSK